MKRISIFLTTLSISFLMLNCNNSAGSHLVNGDNYGKSYTIGDDTMTSRLLELTRAYSNKDTEDLLEYYDDDFLGENGGESTKKWLESMDSISMDPYVIIPVKLKGDSDTKVLAWSKEERHYKNGSYEKLDLMEYFNFNSDGKVDDFRQWKSIDSANFGKSYGGKFIGGPDNEYKGRPLVFSDRNEVAIIEKLVEDYNEMNIEEFIKPFADQTVLNTYKGERLEMKKSEMFSLFDDYKSVYWVPYAIIPLKIYNTDAESGVQVMSKETRVFKNGKVWEKELFEIFYFNL
jgi:hypothetical protein